MNTATATAPAAAQPDLATVKTRQRAAWSSGDYAVVGTTLQIVGEALCEAMDLRSTQRVLDVAAGNGNASLADIRTERRQFVFRNLSAAHWIEVFRNCYGPVLRAFEALEPTRHEDLHAALVGLLGRRNRGGRESEIVPGEYLEVVVHTA